MELIEAVLLGIVQGITEFLPVSSSGHLKLIQLMFGLKNVHNYILFDLVCHLGTLCAVVWIMNRDIINLFRNRHHLKLLALATLPLVLTYFLFHSSLKKVYGDPQFLGVFFIITAIVLFLGEKFSVTRPSTNESHVVNSKRNFYEATTIGCAQALAIFPGISRSAATISAARWVGWNREQAARFSFLLSIPTICGGVFLEGIAFLKAPNHFSSISSWSYGIGFFASFAIGSLVLTFFLKILKKYSLKPFAWYCLLLGISTILYFNFLSF